MIVTLGRNDLFCADPIPSVTGQSGREYSKPQQDARGPRLLVRADGTGHTSGQSDKTTFLTSISRSGPRSMTTNADGSFSRSVRDGKQPDLAQARSFFQADGGAPERRRASPESRRCTGALKCLEPPLIDQINARNR